MELDPLDDVLNLEDDYYNQGFDEGLLANTKEQYIEGKEYGYQTGFQRFIIVGYIKGLLQKWKQNESDHPASLVAHVAQLSVLVDSIPLTNGDEEVAVYEKNLTKARNKLRVITTLTKEQYKINSLDALVNEVAGKLQVSENVDDMW